MTENPTADRPNIRQVTVLAGVSHMTVSRVLNNYPNIKDSTRRRVLEVIEELNYRPNSAARALASSRTRRIGFTTKVTQKIAIKSSSKICGTTGNMGNPGRVLVK